MYNLLLILLTLKGKHVDQDLTYEGLVGFDVMNTKSSSSSSLILLGAGTVAVVLLVTLLLFKSNCVSGWRMSTAETPS